MIKLSLQFTIRGSHIKYYIHLKPRKYEYVQYGAERVRISHSAEQSLVLYIVVCNTK